MESYITKNTNHERVKLAQTESENSEIVGEKASQDLLTSLPLELLTRVVEWSVYQGSSPLNLSETCRILYRVTTGNLSNFFLKTTHKLAEREVIWGVENQPATMIDAALKALKEQKCQDAALLIQGIVQFGDESNLKIDKGLINIKDTMGYTVLHYAAREGHAETLRTLIEHGAEIETKCNSNWTALHLTAMKGHTEALRTLIARDAEIEAKDKYGWTALHLAAREGHAEAVEALLAQGAAIEARDHSGKTALHLAVTEGRTETLRTLIAQGAEIEAQNDFGGTVLTLAINLGHTETAKFLIMAKNQQVSAKRAR